MIFAILTNEEIIRNFKINYKNILVVMIISVINHMINFIIEIKSYLLAIQWKAPASPLAAPCSASRHFWRRCTLCGF